MAYWYDGAALAATGSPVIALFWCLIKFTTTTTTTIKRKRIAVLFLKKMHNIYSGNILVVWLEC